MTTELPRVRHEGLIGKLNTVGRKPAMYAFLVVVLAHWAEHLTRAVQVFVPHWPRPQAGEVLGLRFPWLVTSEWPHYGYAIVMLAGLWLLRHGFTGRARTWTIALGIQVWHHFEHLLLLVQAVTGANLMGKKVPTSIAQLVFPRVEPHLFHNAIVFVPMVYRLRPNAEERARAVCSCAPVRV